MFYIDPLYVVISLPALIISLLANIVMNLWYGMYSKKENKMGLTGREAAEKIATNENFSIKYQESHGNLDDHFDPRSQIVTLSKKVAGEPSIASVAITAHEFGHVAQYHSKSNLMKFRTFLVPIVNFGTYLGYIFIIIGLIISFSQLSWLGVVLFSGATFMSLMTIPIEIDASRRAIGFIKEYNLLADSEIGDAKKVLTGAALTYFI